MTESKERPGRSVYYVIKCNIFNHAQFYSVIESAVRTAGYDSRGSPNRPPVRNCQLNKGHFAVRLSSYQISPA